MNASERVDDELSGKRSDVILRLLKQDFSLKFSVLEGDRK